MSVEMKKDCSVIILAAGESSRMGYPKPFLIFKDQTTFIDKIIKEYEEYGCSEIIVVINDMIRYSEEFWRLDLIKEKIKIVVNKKLEHERFYSVKLGLEKNRSDYCFIQNCDNPYVDKKLLEELDNLKSKSGYIVPEIDEQGAHPILIGEEIINRIKESNDDSNLKDALKGFKRIKYDHDDEKILLNFNTPEDYNGYF